jgi:hypothetical protein
VASSEPMTATFAEPVTSAAVKDSPVPIVEVDTSK